MGNVVPVLDLDDNCDKKKNFINEWLVMRYLDMAVRKFYLCVLL